MTPKTCPQKWVFIRGLTRSRFHWLGFENEFKNYFKIESVELPEIKGNGYLSEELSPLKIEEAVLQLKDQIKPTNEKIGLLALSMGGMIATKWAELFPDEVSHLILINTSFSSLSPFYHRLLIRNYFGIIQNFLIHDPVKMEKFIMSATSNFPEKWKPRLQEMVEFQKAHPVSLTNFMRQLKMSGQAEFKNKPESEILIVNSLKDQLVSSSCSEAIAKQWGCQIKSHPTAGHDLPLDDSTWILEAIQKSFFAQA